MSDDVDIFLSTEVLLPVAVLNCSFVETIIPVGHSLFNVIFCMNISSFCLLIALSVAITVTKQIKTYLHLNQYNAFK